MPNEQDNDRGRAAPFEGSGAEHDVDRSTPASAPAENGKIDRHRVWDVSFRLGVSRRYNAKLAAHYAGFANLATVASLIGGSVSFGNALGGVSGAALAASLIVTAASAFSLVFRWADKARAHTDFYRQYTRLQERLVRAGEPPAPDVVRDIHADLLQIEESEPAPKVAFMLLCQAEEAISLGRTPDPRTRLRWWQCLCAPLLTLPPKTWE